jgi:hypothetical protein
MSIAEPAASRGMARGFSVGAAEGVEVGDSVAAFVGDLDMVYPTGVSAGGDPRIDSQSIVDGFRVDDRLQEANRKRDKPEMIMVYAILIIFSFPAPEVHFHSIPHGFPGSTFFRKILFENLLSAFKKLGTESMPHKKKKKIIVATRRRFSSIDFCCIHLLNISVE